jgi:hypothetical protein
LSYVCAAVSRAAGLLDLDRKREEWNRQIVWYNDLKKIAARSEGARNALLSTAGMRTY